MVKYTLKNRRKKTMKRKGKTVTKRRKSRRKLRKTRKTLTKRRNMKRKTRRRKVAGAPDVFTKIYRKAHKGLLGKESVGEKGERIAEANKRVAGWLKDIRDSGDYNELNDVSELKVGNTYFEFYGEDAQLRHLGKFIKEEQEGYSNYQYGNNFKLIFDNYELTGFNKGGEVYPPNTSLKGRVFETNVAASFTGGRKRKTRKGGDNQKETPTVKEKKKLPLFTIEPQQPNVPGPTRPVDVRQEEFAPFGLRIEDLRNMSERDRENQYTSIAMGLNQTPIEARRLFRLRSLIEEINREQGNNQG